MVRRLSFCEKAFIFFSTQLCDCCFTPHADRGKSDAFFVKTCQSGRPQISENQLVQKWWRERGQPAVMLIVMRKMFPQDTNEHIRYISPVGNTVKQPEVITNVD